MVKSCNLKPGTRRAIEGMLEVIVESVEDAVAAEAGGAGRLEVVRELSVGGLTPQVELVSAIRSAVRLPLRVMVRESADDEVSRMMEVVGRLERLGVDGVVVGFLEDRKIDLDLTRQILSAGPTLKATFHHAFEDTEDKFEALRQIKLIPQVDRVLSHGGTNDSHLKAERLIAYARAAAPELTLIAGGGIDRDIIPLLKNDLREFHVGRAARAGSRVSGELVKKLVEAIYRRDAE